MIAVLAIAALAAFAVWEEWLNLIVGLWTLVSPWVLGFQGTTAMTVHVIVGAAVAILAAIELLAAARAGGRLERGSSSCGLPVRIAIRADMHVAKVDVPRCSRRM